MRSSGWTGVNVFVEATAAEDICPPLLMARGARFGRRGRNDTTKCGSPD